MFNKEIISTLNNLENLILFEDKLNIIKYSLNNNEIISHLQNYKYVPQMGYRA